MIRKFALTVALASSLLVVGSNGFAQEQQSNPALRAIVSFGQLLSPEVIAELRLLYPTDEALAQALLETLQAQGVIDAQTVADMSQSIVTGVLPRDTLIIFLADVSNGTEVLTTRNPFALETELALVVPTLEIPRGDASGNLTADEVGTVVVEVAVGDGGILDSIASAYRDAITPRNAAEGGA
jgi:hypothetical protein